MSDQNFNDIGPKVLDCGCVFNFSEVDGSREMTVSPCRPTCDNLALVVGKYTLAGKTIGFRKITEK